LLGRLLLLAAGAAAAGCTTQFNFGDALIAIPAANDMLNQSPDVAIVVVNGDNGHVYPKKLIVRQGQHAIVWVAAADKLIVTFPGGELTPQCAGAICTSKAPAAVSEGPGFEYGGTVTKAGVDRALDPRLEVVR
jgi:hypothetical protein